MGKKSNIFPWVMSYVGGGMVNGQTLPPRRAVICDLLIWLQPLTHRRSVSNPDFTGGSVEGRNDELAVRFTEYASQLFQQTESVFFCCDQTEYVSMAKGPTQMGRTSEPGLLPDFEVRHEGITKELRDGHEKALSNIRMAQLEKKVTADRYSFVNDDQPEVVCHKLGLEYKYLSTMSPANMQRAIVNASLSQPLPSPWNFAISSASGNRGRTMIYLMQILIFSLRRLNPSPGRQLIVDGHYCSTKTLSTYPWFDGDGLESDARLQDFPLVLTNNAHVGMDDDKYTINSPLVGTQVTFDGKLGPKKFHLQNTIGEADHKMIYLVDRIHSECPPKNPDDIYEVITTDTDTFLQFLWYMNRKHHIDQVPLKELPRVILLRVIQGNASYYDMREIYRLFDAMINAGFENTSALSRAARVFSMLAVSFMYDSDYTIGFSFITIEKLFASYLAYRDDPRPSVQIGNLVLVDLNRPVEMQICVEAHAFLKLYFLAFYDVHKTNFDKLAKKGMLNFPQDLKYEHVKAVGDFNIKSYLDSIANPTMPLKKFRSVLTQLGRSALSREQLLARFLCLSNYVSMMSQLGQPNILLMDPMFFGYRRPDETQAASSINIECIATADLFHLTKKRKDLLAAHQLPKPCS